MDLVPVNTFITGLNIGLESERVAFKESARPREYRSSLEHSIRRTNKHRALGEKSYQHGDTQIIKLQSSTCQITCNHTVTWQQERRWSFSAWQGEQD